ncbi:protein-tyrosine phosphatase-like protein [Achaetomium macrosporum]|uniref:Protein-tyrosine phosphatase-like protein n=1 Tax=Achaetomium macrosporum TaxID=79813 RepID=A0AAN7H565_9PEZI|nr:protein-tyrosine phosphatase-like protein [Achaetomium macrosporum]
MSAPQSKHVYANVQALRGGKPELGDVVLSDYHLVFQFPPESKTSTDPRLKKHVKQVWFAFHVISQCTLRPTPPSSGVPSSIRIRFRDFTYVCFNFTDDKQARDAFEFIRARTCRLGSIEDLLAFNYAPPAGSPENKIDGWSLYDVRAEFKRQGISEKSADLGWRISTINKDYTFSPTYPALLVVPSKISDSTLKYAANFRSRARIPTLTYLHPVNNCTITRSSQPFVGLRFKRSIQDERLVGACFSASLESSDTASPPSDPDRSPSFSTVDLSADNADADLSLSEMERMRQEDELIAGANAQYDEKTGKRLIYGAQQHNLIVDARPLINSLAMQAIGKGSENMDYYRFAKKVFLNIDNIHVMRDSLEKVVSAIKDSDVSPFPPNRELLEKSKWIKHITSILGGSAIIARQVGIQHSHVLIHCSDGWDRTSQLSALAQLMLDPYYRTIDGFIVLVEKDWLSFGHMFQLRSGHLSHENWFAVDSDTLAGSTVRPGESEGRGDAIENALATARRFWNRNVGGEKDMPTSDPEDPLAVDETRQTNAPVTEDQATRLKEVSPVFHQFLDATYQLLRQHPTRFEFNERFLRRLLYHVYSCQYGTFLFNNERERHQAKLRERTRSVWAYFLSRRQEFTNDQYDPVIDDHTKGRERLIFPRLSEVRWWYQVFGRTDDEMNGAINASIATAERVAAYQAASGLTEPTASVDAGSQSGAGSEPPGLAASKSVLVGVENAHEALTPESRTSASLNRSGSTGNISGALGALQDRISGLGIGTAMFGGSGGERASSGRNRPGAHSTESNGFPSLTDATFDDGRVAKGKAAPDDDDAGKEMKTMH